MAENKERKDLVRRLAKIFRRGQAFGGMARGRVPIGNRTFHQPIGTGRDFLHGSTPLYVQPRQTPGGTFSRLCITGDTKLVTSHGIKTIKELHELWESGAKKILVYAYDKKKDVFLMAPCENPAPTKEDEVWKIELDDGTTIRCNDKHPFLTADKGYIEAKNLKEGTSIKVINRFLDDLGYWRVITNDKKHVYKHAKKQMAEHKLIYETFNGRKVKSGNIIHHINFQRTDNSIENLNVMGAKEHWKYHSETIAERNRTAGFKEKIAIGRKKYWENPEAHENLSKITKEYWNRPENIIKATKRNKKTWESPKRRQEMSERTTELWQSKEYREKVVAGIGRWFDSEEGQKDLERRAKELGPKISALWKLKDGPFKDVTRKVADALRGRPRPIEWKMAQRKHHFSENDIIALAPKYEWNINHLSRCEELNSCGVGVLYDRIREWGYAGWKELKNKYVAIKNHKVVRITNTHKKEMVYDITVPNYENFGILCDDGCIAITHNSSMAEFCLAEDTPIVTQHGILTIKEIAKRFNHGEEIYVPTSTTTEFGCSLDNVPISAAKLTGHSEILYKIKVLVGWYHEDTEPEEMYFRATGGHNLIQHNGEKIKVENLYEGCELRGYNRITVKISSVQKEEGKHNVYNLTVPKTHNYAILLKTVAENKIDFILNVGMAGIFVSNSEMDADSIISSALDLYSDETVSEDEMGDIIKIYSPSDNIQSELESLFFNTLTIESFLWMWCREMCKYGDNFLMLDLHEKHGVVGALPIPANEIEREEGFDPDDPLGVRFRWLTRQKRNLSLHEVIHFRLLTSTFSLPYGRCCAGHVGISVPNGIKRMDDIKEGDIVFSFNPKTQKLEKTKVKKKIHSGEKEIFSIATTHSILDVSAEHPVLIKENGTLSYKKAKDLRVGNILVSMAHKQVEQGKEIPVPLPYEDKEKYYSYVLPQSQQKVRERILALGLNKTKKTKHDLSYNKLFSGLCKKYNTHINTVRAFLYGRKGAKRNYSQIPYPMAQKVLQKLQLGEDKILLSAPVPYKTRNIISLPKTVTKDFGWLFGFMLGDGYWQDAQSYNFSKGLAIALGEDEGKNKKVFDLCKKYNVPYWTGYKKENGKRIKKDRIILLSTTFARIMYKMGFHGTAYTKRIPGWVFDAKKEIREAILEGITAADGYINVYGKTNKQRFIVNLCNRLLVHDTMLLAKSLGFKTSRVFSEKRVNSYQKKKYNKIKLCSSHTVKYYKEPVPSDDIIEEPIRAINILPQENVYDIQTESKNHNFVANGLVIHNSILDQARRAWRCLIMIEDAMLVFRLVKAPERRIFYIDTANTAPENVESYMNNIIEQVKSGEMTNEATGTMELKFNALSVLDDLFIPVRGNESGTRVDQLPGLSYANDIEDVEYFRKKLIAALKIPPAYLTYDEGIGCLPIDTKIRTLDKRKHASIKEIIEDLQNKKEVWTFSCTKEGKILPGRITDAFFTGIRNDIYKITLDNGESITCTSNHPFMLRDGEYRQAGSLIVGNSLMPLEVQYNTRVAKIEKLNIQIPVYDISVEGIPNFPVEAGVFLHNSKATLASEDVRYAKTVRRLQNTIIPELYKIAVIHLYAKGVSGNDLLNFDIKLATPSNIAELQNLELWRTRLEIAGAAQDGIFSKDFIYRILFKLSDEDIQGMYTHMLREKLIMSKIEQAEFKPLEEEGGQEEQGQEGGEKAEKGGEKEMPSPPERPTEGSYPFLTGTRPTDTGRRPFGNKDRKHIDNLSKHVSITADDGTGDPYDRKHFKIRKRVQDRIMDNIGDHDDLQRLLTETKAIQAEDKREGMIDQASRRIDNVSNLLESLKKTYGK